MASIAYLPIAAFSNCICSLFGSCCERFTCKILCTNFTFTHRNSSYMYYFIAAIITMCSFVTEHYGGDIVLGGRTMKKVSESVAQLTNNNTCPQKYGGWVICCAKDCSGIFSVYRFSIALFCFSLSMSLLTCRKSFFSSKVHCGFWFAKLFFIVLLVISTLFIGNEQLLVYREISRYMSMPFLLIQIALLIDYAYKCNEKCVKMDENINKTINWKYLILIVTMQLYLVCIATIISLFISLKNGNDLERSILFSTIFIIVFVSILSVSKIAPHGTLFTSSVVSSYITYLCYSSLLSYSYNNFGNNNSDMMLGFLFTTISVVSVIWSVTETQRPFDGKTLLLDEGCEHNKRSWKYFHFMMAMSSLYICMQLTNWSSSKDDEEADQNTSSFWIKIWSQWLCFTLYTWTLIAPYLFRNYRDFGVEFD